MCPSIVRTRPNFLSNFLISTLSFSAASGRSLVFEFLRSSSLLRSACDRAFLLPSFSDFSLCSASNLWICSLFPIRVKQVCIPASTLASFSARDFNMLRCSSVGGWASQPLIFFLTSRSGTLILCIVVFSSLKMFWKSFFSTIPNSFINEFCLSSRPLRDSGRSPGYSASILGRSLLLPLILIKKSEMTLRSLDLHSIRLLLVVLSSRSLDLNRLILSRLKFHL
mmetsp:Transcript_25410/g.39859  ORF Transcript_25410/g.39859 Transcript_25410/m.39859 type:complete len:224 (+) Transcript_25410:177-848(+)